MVENTKKYYVLQIYTLATYYIKKKTENEQRTHHSFSHRATCICYILAALAVLVVAVVIANIF